jgi:hypothetical protein
MDEKLCECGCGKPSPICKYTNRNYGYVKGEPLRFIPGHQGFLTKWSDEQRRKFRESRAGIPRSEETKEKISRTHIAKGTRPSIEAIAKSNETRGKRENSPSWRGGVTFTAGYRCRYQPEHPRAHQNGYVYEHILIAEKGLGRSLVRGEVVHHIDGNKLNNSPDNLAVLQSQAEHVKLHRQESEQAR